MKYIIENRNYGSTMVEFLNTDTTSTEDLWWSYHEIGKQTNNKLSFNSRKDAEPYLNAIKNYALKDWDQHEHIHRMHGVKKPQWKIYTKK
jgi:hypothetical protein